MDATLAATAPSILERILAAYKQARTAGRKPRYLIVGEAEFAALRVDLFNAEQPADAPFRWVLEDLAGPERVYGLDVVRIDRASFFAIGY